MDRISDHVWEIVKCIGDSLEAKDDDFENDIFYTPPNSPYEPIFAKLEEHLVVNCGRKRSCILLDKHLQICYQVLYLQLGWPHRPPRVTLKFVGKNQARLSQMHISSVVGPSRVAMQLVVTCTSTTNALATPNVSSFMQVFIPTTYSFTSHVFLHYDVTVIREFVYM